jgi:uncharacterized membrane protein
MTEYREPMSTELSPGPLPAPLARVPADLWLVALVTAVAWAGLALLPPGHPLAVVVAVAFLLVAPGYALTAALFPGASRDATASAGPGVDLPERLAYSLALSIVVSPLVGMALGLSPAGLWASPLVLAVGGATLLAAGVAAVRRASLPAEARFDPVADLRTREPDWLVLVVVSLAVLAAVGAVGTAVVQPPGEAFSELYLLSPGADGGLVAGATPGSVTLGEPVELVVGVDNHEGVATAYTVVATLQRVDGGGTVTESVEVGRWRATVADGEGWRLAHEVRPAMAGEDLRLAYLLYAGDVPAEPSLETADYEVHLWLDVVDPAAGGTEAAAGTG